MALDFTVEEWNQETKWKKGIVHCQARATEIRDRALRVLELENSLGKFKKGICLRSGVWTTIKGQGMRRPEGISILQMYDVWTCWEKSVAELSLGSINIIKISLVTSR